MLKYRMNPHLLPALALASGLLCACSKERKMENGEPQVDKTEVPGHVEGKGEDGNALPSSEAIDRASQVIKHLDVVKNQDEMKVAVESLSQNVALLQDLLKKYRATGEEKFKRQALEVAQKANEIREKIRKADVVPEGRRMTEAGDLFGELEKAWSELQ